MNDPRFTARNLIDQHKDYLFDLWLSYWANGGNAGMPEFEAFIRGMSAPQTCDLQILAWAITEVLADPRPQ